MEIVYLALDDITQMTMQVGGDWAATHAKRLLELVKQISVDVPYDPHVMELAAYMHDWGAFPTYSQKDGEHAVRSRQVVGSEILMHLDLTTEQKTILLETIELHGIPRHDRHGARIRARSQECRDLL